MKPLISLILASFLLSQMTIAVAAPLPKTIVLEELTTAPMGMEVKSKKYIEYSNDPHKYKEYEERVEKNIMGVNKIFVLKEGYIISTYNQGDGSCTTTDISAVTGMAAGADPEKLAASMKKSMGLVKVGGCDGAGRPGVLYASSMGKICYDKEFESVVLWADMMGSKVQTTLVEFNVKLPELKLPLPDDVVCEPGPDLEAIMSGSGQDRSHRDEDTSSSAENNRSMPEHGEALQRAQEAMKQMQELFKEMGQ